MTNTQIEKGSPPVRSGHMMRELAVAYTPSYIIIYRIVKV